jgi:multiple sugar transport system permease protein
MKRNDRNRGAALQPKGQRRCRRRGRAWAVLMWVLLIGIGATFLLPLVWALGASLKPLDQVYSFPPQLWPDQPLWSNYPESLRRLPFARFIGNTCLITLAAVAGTVLTSSMVGYSFARLRWRGRNFWFVVLLATMMLPAQVLLIPHFLQYKWLGWVNTYKPLIVPSWLGGGAFFIFLFRQFFRAVPKELEEAALLDGAGHWQIYTRIMMPLAKPAVATVAVLSFIGHWQEFMAPLIYLSDFQKYPVSLGLRMYESLEGTWANLLMAASLVTLLPLAVLFFVAQRYFVRGLLLTGSKG